MSQSRPTSHPASILAKFGKNIFSFRIWIGLAFAAAAIVLVNSPRGFVQHDPRLRAVSVLAVFCGLLLRAWGSGCAGNHTRLKEIVAPRLVTWGPYSVVRHPIYLGTLILGLGMVGLLGEERLLPFYAVACVVLYTTMIPAEEAHLRRTFGSEYDMYCAQVPQIVPRLSLPSATDAQSFSWRSAIGEWHIALILLLIYVGFRLLPVRG